MKIFDNLVSAEDDNDDNNGDNKRSDRQPSPPSEPETDRRSSYSEDGGGDLNERFPLVDGPMPQRRPKTIYPFERLEVDQGRAIGPETKELTQRLYSAVHSYNKNHRKQFRVVKQLGRVELWRIS